MKILQEISFLIKLHKILKNASMKNLKTTLSGVAAIVVQALPVVWTNPIAKEVAHVLSFIFVGVGLLSAKDHNVTGGTIQQ